MKFPTTLLTASALVLASASSLAQTRDGATGGAAPTPTTAPTEATTAAASQPARVGSEEPTRPTPVASGPSLRFRLGAAGRPLLGYSLLGLHRPSDGSWLQLDAVPGLQLSERFTVELGVNAMFPFMDTWGLATFRLALTPAAHFDLGSFYARVGVPVMVSDAVRFGVQGAVGVTISKRFYVGLVGDALVPDLVAGLGLELGVRFGPVLLSGRR